MPSRRHHPDVSAVGEIFIVRASMEGVAPVLNGFGGVTESWAALTSNHLVSELHHGPSHRD